ncbi:MAG: hypothetical protein ACFB10_04885 [Salibacteraceae bacterium]
MSKLHHIGPRITWYEKDQSLYVTISGKVEPWKETLLMVWLLAWTICGSIVAGQLAFAENSQQNFIFLLIYLSFWLYFELRIGRAFLWRKYGNERLRIGEGKMFYKREMRSFGKAKTYITNNIQKFQIIDQPDRSFAKAYGKSWWVVGGETIEFDYLGNSTRIAMQLQQEEVKAIHHVMRQKIREQNRG